MPCNTSAPEAPPLDGGGTVAQTPPTGTPRSLGVVVALADRSALAAPNDGAPPSPLKEVAKQSHQLRSSWTARLLGTGLALVIPVLTQQSSAVERPRPPTAERKPVTMERHGLTLTDDYAWLRTEKLEELLEKPDILEPEIRKHLEAESRYAKAILAPNRALERRLVGEMRARVSRHDESVPEAWGPWEYYSRYQTGQQRRVHLRRPRGGGPEHAMLDENVLARGRRAFSVAEIAVSPSHALLAYALDADGSERNTLKVRDLATGKDLADEIPEVRGGAVWSLDSQWLFYVGRDPTKWGQKVYRHKLGTPATDDQLVYEEMEEGFSVSLRVSLSDRFLIIEAGDFSTTDLKLVDLTRPTELPRSIAERK